MKIANITNGIFIGDVSSSYNVSMLKKLDIHHVLYICNNNNKSLLVYNKYKKHNITHRFIKYTPGSPSKSLSTGSVNLLNTCDKAYAFINDCVKNNKNILVHCCKGVNLSPIIVSYYLMKKMLDYFINEDIQKRDVLDDILCYVHQHKPDIAPDSRIVNQLKDYEEKILQGKYIYMIDESI